MHKNKVYLVLGSVPYEGEWVIGIYKTRELAEAQAKVERAADTLASSITYEVEEWDVN